MQGAHLLLAAWECSPMRPDIFPSFKTETPVCMDVHRSLYRVKTSHM
nr:MAG TPA: hypothetical protein [Caudoviricetes sp.]DAP47859.1 MAG TPA: hypothetical protein [Caudoviricetes sp.]